MAEMLGSTRGVVGLNLLKLSGAGRDRIAQLVAGALEGKLGRYEGPYTSVAAGKTFEALALLAPIHGPSGEVRGGVGIVQDVSERKRIQSQLARADRMASIGTLAAGVAHEINNPLVYVLLGLELIERELSKLQTGTPSPEEWDRVRSYCRDALEGAERVRSIVRDLRTFSRPGDERAGPVDVEKVLESSINMAQSHIRQRARLERDFQRVPAVLGDESRLGQVFLNLLVNAAQAIPEGAPDQHRIVLRTRTGSEGEAIVEVEDSGVGIENWKMERIFEPFWTDKPVGVGTGLGLSIVHGIVVALGGEITVRSEPGRGSTFRVILPPQPARTEPDTPPASAVVPGVVLRPRVLLIDDEPNLGITLSTGLREHADLVSVRSGTEAVRLLLADGAFDLILCDLMMPDLTGMDVFEQISRQRPALRERFVFTTGGAVTERAREFLEQHADHRLDKPFRLEQVEALLSRR
jgi:PAS domain S-box-containing protein